MPEHPDFTPSPNLLTTQEAIRLITIFQSAGVTKLRLTGGEPLMRQDLPEIAQAAVDLNLAVSLTTNGVLLSRRLPALLRAGVSGINLSLDSLCPHTFSLLTRRPPQVHERVLSALHDAVTEPSLSVKLNVVVMSPHNHLTLPDFVRLTESHPLSVRFIEYMPFAGNRWKHASFVPYSEMLRSITHHYGPLSAVATHPNDTAKYFRVPGFQGTIGFISSMSAPFCAGCNRIRVTADGALKTCLFGEHEVSLRDIMRQGASDEQVLETIRRALHDKHFALGGKGDMFGIAAGDNRSMVRIGG
ncbi:GTP 3',8-cyclase, mitochondrial [Gracilariopsis chorda]|uniref:GTP 3',8-cyclase, mitochondrial n=1 Tax=Gracilariopsis chorda TaxID=448386 RepID=A0A2V3INM9_9FLOR|nr:GTP 3',8-cyclase, mitochondrial [Gracilariopsis chorda]|eukprot:PXF43659.1 GTP 3',8-cyclase, mitochondrial [Gracilariopsis chorda]